MHAYRAQEEIFKKTAVKAYETFKQQRSEKLQTSKKECADCESKKAQLDEMKNTLETLDDEVKKWIGRRVSLQMWTDFPEAADPLEDIRGEENFSLEEKIAACDKKVTDKYAELLSLRKKYAEEYAPIAPTLQEVENSLGKSIELKKQEVEELEGNAPLSLEEVADQEERAQLERGFFPISQLALNGGAFNVDRYADLLRLAALASARPECAIPAPYLDDSSLSIVCNEYFGKVLRHIARQESNLSNAAKYLENKLYSTVLTEEEFGGFSIECGEHERRLWDPGVQDPLIFLSETFLSAVLKALEENPELNLPRLALRLIDHKSSEEHIAELEEFLRLFEETPEERLVTEQRYYQQKLLEEAQRKNKILDRQREEEEERFEREQAEARHRERERLAEEREMERERERAEIRREQAEKRAQAEAKENAQRDERRQKHAEAYRARQQCYTCANYGHCAMFGQRPNCTAYRPK